MHSIVYSPQSKWFFTHIPKNGGSSLLERLRYDRHLSKLKYDLDFLPVAAGEVHNPAHCLQLKYTALKNCRPVCIVRNPWDRCLSLYTFGLENAVREKNYKKDWAIGVHARLASEGFKKAWMPGGFFRDEKNMQLGIAHNAGRHWKENDSQLSWITADAHVFKLETELEQLYDFIKIPYNTEKLNQSKHYAYQYYYDSELRAEIQKLYQADIEAFGYHFD